jgi:hypothetical protein
MLKKNQLKKIKNGMGLPGLINQTLYCIGKVRDPRLIIGELVRGPLASPRKYVGLRLHWRMRVSRSTLSELMRSFKASIEEYIILRLHWRMEVPKSALAS